MSNSLFRKITFADIHPILSGGVTSFRKKFWWHVLPTLLLSIITVMVLFVVYHTVDVDSVAFSIGFSVITFLLLNVIISFLLINNQISQEQFPNTTHLHQVKTIFNQTGMFALIVLLSLIELLPSLAFGYIAPQLTSPNQLHIAGVVLQIIVFAIGVIGMFCLIINLRTNGQHKPYHLIGLAIRFILRNFIILVVIHVITVVLFMLINVVFAAGLYVHITAVLMILLVAQFIINLLIMIWGVLVADNCVQLN